MKTMVKVYVKEDPVGTFTIMENATDYWQKFKQACSLNPTVTELESSNGYLFNFIVDSDVKAEILLGEESLPFVAAFRSNPTFEVVEIPDND